MSWKLTSHKFDWVREFETEPVYDADLRGWSVDGALYMDPDGSEHSVERVVARARTVDSNEFFAMFTAFEEVGIRDFAGGAKVGDNAQVATARKVVAVLLGRLERAVTVNLDLQANIDGVNFLVSLGLLTPARATEILAGPLV